MSQYTVDIEIDPYWVNIYNAADSTMTLCMAKATARAGGPETFNVVANTFSKFQPTMHFTWSDKYSIKATTTAFKKGVVISGEAQGSDISFQQTYDIKDWNTVSTYTDSGDVDNKSFGFKNAITCSILLCLKNGDDEVPVYISPHEVAPGKTSITPIPKVMFWFQEAVATSTMVTNYTGSSITVQPSPGAAHSKIHYTKDGTWVSA